MLWTHTRFRAQHRGLTGTKAWKQKWLKRRKHPSRSRAHHVENPPEIRGEIIDSGHFWGKSLTPIPTWKSHFRDLCDLYVEAHFFTFAICFIKTDLITNSSLQRLYMLRIKHIVSQQQTGTSLHSTKTKRQFFWSFLKNPHPPFWLGFFKINRQQHIDLSILLPPQVYPPRDSLPVGSPHWQIVF